ncbi:MAG: hypothetical protein IKV87_08195 [Methanobrevibacter sp.]|nr:hypothetical protein [Methanobrevibacter sp.]
MNSKVIKLTEAELHQIIRESVDSLLAELDWRTYANASNKAFEKAKTEETPEERRLRRNQASKFHNAAIAKQENQYDGVHQGNYDDRNIQPSHKRVDDKGKTVNFMRNNFGNDDNVKPVDRDKQIRGAAHIARFNRGGDEYRDGKWRENKK